MTYTVHHVGDRWEVRRGRMKLVAVRTTEARARLLAGLLERAKSARYRRVAETLSDRQAELWERYSRQDLDKWPQALRDHTRDALGGDHLAELVAEWVRGAA